MHSLVTMRIPEFTRLTEVPPEQRQILTVPFCLETVRGDEPKRGGVHAVAETGGLRPVESYFSSELNNGSPETTST